MFLSSFIQKEFQYFNKLSANGQILISSITVSNIANPILSTFVTASLWRSSFDPIIVASYTLTNWLVCPIAFYINGQLIKKIPVNKMFFAGTLIQGLVAASLLIFHPIGLLPIIFFGIINGFGLGFYFSNRNFLTFKSVTDEKQLYFYSLTNVSATITSIVIPPIAGWFIITNSDAYAWLGTFSLLIVMFSAFIGGKIKFGKQNLGRISLQKVSPNWQNIRQMMFTLGLVNGLEMFLPGILILTKVGNEKVLGTIMAVVSIISALAIYELGRREKNNLLKILLTSLIFTLLSAVILAFYYSPTGIIIFLILNSVAISFRWLAVLPIFYNSISIDRFQNINHHFSYVFDVEVILNIGRAVGIVTFILAYWKYPSLAIQYVLPLFCLIQLANWYFGKKIAQTLKT